MNALVVFPYLLFTLKLFEPVLMSEIFFDIQTPSLWLMIYLRHKKSALFTIYLHLYYSKKSQILLEQRHDQHHFVLNLNLPCYSHIWLEACSWGHGFGWWLWVLLEMEHLNEVQVQEVNSKWPFFLKSPLWIPLSAPSWNNSHKFYS